MSVLPPASPDSPGIPPSANTHQLFRGFSFVATSLGQEQSFAGFCPNTDNPIVQVMPPRLSSEPLQLCNYLRVSCHLPHTSLSHVQIHCPSDQTINQIFQQTDVTSTHLYCTLTELQTSAGR